ncbi:hypothetical protein BGZ95_011474 [Linnemannia exigua]|uniref:Uncharacterized protein n=1 Tax=Linnemannia exigua TaxID=604196 RepID=A0AAD4H6E3_9FUNG|nr:hypothetical protein BGZ95_011474 [Linnemannia exigua]
MESSSALASSVPQSEQATVLSRPASVEGPLLPVTSAASNSTASITHSSAELGKTVPPQESYSPWDMPPINQPASSGPEPRISSGLKGFSNTNTTWPLFRSKPHPTISVPITPVGHSRSTFDMAAPSTPPRNSAYSNADDSDNAMCTPTFGSGSYSRRNSAISVMALDTPPPLSLMDLEPSSSHSGSSFGSAAGLGSGSHGSLSRSTESGFNGTNLGYPFPLFSMRGDISHTLSRRSSRANSVSMESRHARKPSEDTHMSDGGNNSGSERSRRHSPAVVPFERSVRRSALLPKPKGLLKVFSQLEEEAHHNRHEYDHERETTQVRKGNGAESGAALMDTGGVTPNRLGTPPLHMLGNIRRPSTSRLNPEQELHDFQRQQEELSKIYQLQQLQQLSQATAHPEAQTHPHPLQAMLPVQEPPTMEGAAHPSYLAQYTSMASSPSSPLLAPMATRSKRKSSTCEERFDPYHSVHLKRRAVSPSIGPLVSHRRSPSSSPARHLTGHSRSKIASLPSPSGTGSFFRHGYGPFGMIAPGTNGGIHTAGSTHGSTTAGDSEGAPANNSNSVTSSAINLQHTSRSFSELSLGMPKNQQA